MARPLTIEHLTNARACPRDTALFRKHFADGNECTLDRVMSVALVFDWNFAARHLLTERQRKYFRAQMIGAFRRISRTGDGDKVKRRTAMARAFYHAYNGIEG